MATYNHMKIILVSCRQILHTGDENLSDVAVSDSAWGSCCMGHIHFPKDFPCLLRQSLGKPTWQCQWQMDRCVISFRQSARRSAGRMWLNFVDLLLVRNRSHCLRVKLLSAVHASLLNILFNTFVMYCCTLGMVLIFLAALLSSLSSPFIIDIGDC